jgi:hypothetical protein
MYCLRRKLAEASSFSVPKYLHYELKYNINNYTGHILWYNVPTVMLWMLQWYSCIISMHKHYLYQLQMLQSCNSHEGHRWYEWSTNWLIMFCYFQFLNKDPATTARITRQIVFRSRASLLSVNRFKSSWREMSFRYAPYCRFLCQIICSVRSFCKHQKISRVVNELPLSLWMFMKLSFIITDLLVSDYPLTL